MFLFSMVIFLKYFPFAIMKSWDLSLNKGNSNWELVKLYGIHKQVTNYSKEKKWTALKNPIKEKQLSFEWAIFLKYQNIL